MKTENQVFADVFAVINTFLQSASITDWVAMQGYQPIPQGFKNNVIKLWSITTSRVGWQGERYYELTTSGSEKPTLYRQVQWREEKVLQLDFYKRRAVTDTASTISAVDMANMLRAYLSGSVGIGELLKKGYSPLQIQNIRIPHFEDDGKLYQTMPGFDLTLLYDQTLDHKQAEVIDIDENGNVFVGI